VSYDEAIGLIKAAGRPVTLTFQKREIQADGEKHDF
jgi:hypothetical protein